jgi:SAM-dependent methyltransferase
MKLSELQRNWDVLGKEDPFWAIITWQDKRGNRWDPAEFFASGREEIAEVMEYLAGLKLESPRRRALDFGCGVGRLTRALASYFAKVTGIDIAPSMIARAQALNVEERCEFILNDRADLSIFGDSTFDFVYSNLVLQHMRPEYSTAYIREFCRVLVPGGVAIFQLPSKGRPPERHRSWKDRVRPLIPPLLLSWYRHRHPGVSSAEAAPPLPARARMEMYTVPKAQVLGLVETSGCSHVDAVENTAAGPGYESWRYCIEKRKRFSPVDAVGPSSA